MCACVCTNCYSYYCYCWCCVAVVVESNPVNVEISFHCMYICATSIQLASVHSFIQATNQPADQATIHQSQEFPTQQRYVTRNGRKQSNSTVSYYFKLLPLTPTTTNYIFKY